MTITRLAAVWLIFLPFLSCTGQSQQKGEDPVQRLDVEAFAGKLESLEEFQLIDVRTASEFADGHIEGAVNINVLDEEAFDSAVSGLDRDKPVLLYCQAGGRSMTAARKMEAMGFERILELREGYRGWSAKKQ